MDSQSTDGLNFYSCPDKKKHSPLMDEKSSADGIKIFAALPLTWIHKCAQSTDGLTHSPLLDWIVTPALTKKKKKQSSDGLKFVCCACWNKNFLCFARQNHTNSPLIAWILYSSKSYALYAMMDWNFTLALTLIHAYIPLQNPKI